MGDTDLAKVWIWLLLLSIATATNLFHCDVSEYYKGFDPNEIESNFELKRVLHDLIDEHKVFPYSRVDEIIIDISPIEFMVTGIYSGIQFTSTSFPDLWNKEHVWPRSRGVYDEGADTSDLFHIFPSAVSLNSARSNKYFDDCERGTFGCISPVSPNQENSPGAFVVGGPGSSENSTTFAPPDNMKGDVARAVFYMAVRYDGSEDNTVPLLLENCNSEATCGPNTLGNLETLIEWHKSDPVDLSERRRADNICTRYQGNRNPFIDFPELVDRLADTFSTEEESSVAFDNSPYFSAILFFLVFAVFAGISKVSEIKGRHDKPAGPLPGVNENPEVKLMETNKQNSNTENFAYQVNSQSQQFTDNIQGQQPTSQGPYVVKVDSVPQAQVVPEIVTTTTGIAQQQSSYVTSANPQADPSGYTYVAEQQTGPAHQNQFSHSTSNGNSVQANSSSSGWTYK